MTSEQKKELEKMLNYYSRKAAYCEENDDIQSAFVNQDRIRQIQEVLEVLGYEVNKEEKRLSSNGMVYHTYTITG